MLVGSYDNHRGQPVVLVPYLIGTTLHKWIFEILLTLALLQVEINYYLKGFKRNSPENRNTIQSNRKL